MNYITRGAEITLINVVEKQGVFDGTCRVTDEAVRQAQAQANIDFLEYRKRCVLIDAINIIMDRVQSDEQLKDHPITLTINQAVTEDKSIQGKLIHLTVELGTPVEVEFLQDTLIRQL